MKIKRNIYFYVEWINDYLNSSDTLIFFFNQGWGKKAWPSNFLSFTYNQATVRLPLFSSINHFVENPAWIKLSTPDNHISLIIHIHACYSWIMFNMRNLLMTATVVEWIYKTQDVSVISYVESLIFRACRLL